MKTLLFIVTFGFVNCVQAQFQELFDIPDNFSIFTIKDFKLNGDGQGIIIALHATGGSPIYGLMVYNTSDFGNTWDSTYFLNEEAQYGYGAVTESGFLYFVTWRSVYPIGSPGYSLISSHQSFDNGVSWITSVIDTSYGAGSSPDNSLYFINDSVGVFYYANGIFTTHDYGTSWQKTPNTHIVPNNSLPINNELVYFEYDSIYIDDLSGNLFDQFYYPFYCQGRQESSALQNNNVYRVMNNWDGASLGAPYGGNYVSMQIDPLPFGNQKVFFFPEIGQSRDLAVPGDCIYMVGGGYLNRSCDQGEHFYKLNSFPTSPATGIVYVEFINDTLGFAVTYNANDHDWKLYKTTNGGGANGDLVLTNHFTAGVEEVQNDFGFEIYPNPSQGQFILRSETPLERIEVFNLLGEKIMSKNVQQTEITLDLVNYESGVYFVRAFSADGLAEQRVVLAK